MNDNLFSRIPSILSNTHMKMHRLAVSIHLTLSSFIMIGGKFFTASRNDWFENKDVMRCIN